MTIMTSSSIIVVAHTPSLKPDLIHCWFLSYTLTFNALEELKEQNISVHINLLFPDSAFHGFSNTCSVDYMWIMDCQHLTTAHPSYGYLTHPFYFPSTFP
jgi:hypothetical protein